MAAWYADLTAAPHLRYRLQMVLSEPCFITIVLEHGGSRASSRTVHAAFLDDDLYSNNPKRTSLDLVEVSIHVSSTDTN